MKPRFIIVSGLIGVGKTHFCEQLAGHLGYQPIFEPVDENEYLGDFYKDPAKYAYAMQEFLKSRRFRLHNYAVWAIRAEMQQGIVMDRSIWEDTVFAEILAETGSINARDYQTYLRGFGDMVHSLMEPDALIFLDAPPETCKARADHRERPQERGDFKMVEEEASGIPLDYMKKLKEGYDRWLEVVAPRMPLVRVNWSNFRRIEDVWPEVLKGLEQRSRHTRSLVLP